MTINNATLLRARLQTWLDAHLKDIAMIAVLGAGCAGFGLFYMRVPENLGYHLATITHVEASFASKAPGIRLWAKTDDGRMIIVRSRRYNAGVREGAMICVQRLRDKLRGRTWHQFALPKRCEAFLNAP
ncbi:MAG: hypothetical protein HUJ27_04605 [Rhodobacteraceae bacterium]|nr:hypothetical protein [Paracoccaceae bacterium]